MPLPNHINPDHYLPTADRRVWTTERGRQAWESAYAELESRLRAVGSPGKLYVVCGLQGSGKSTWITRNAVALGPSAVFFDAALPSRKHRTRALNLAAHYAVPAVAVWINVPIDVALQRNSQRRPDERIAEDTIRHVLEQLQPPSPEEGFVQIIEVRD